MAEKFKIMRAWDKGLNKIAYVYRNPETGKKGIGETKFDWFFYVLTDDYERLRNKFNQFISNNVINSIAPEGKYTRIYADYPHRTESLSKELERDWGYKTFAFNDMLEKLEMLECETFEADILPHARFAIQDNVEFEQDYKVLFFDIETDDRIKNGQPIPGEFRILSVAMKDFADGKEAFMRIAEDTDEEERNLLIRLGKIFNSYDVIIGWNSLSFDVPYVKSRMMRYGIQLDWRKIFHQDQMKVFQKSVSLRSYSLENVSQEYLGEGKVQHEGIGVYEMWLNHPELLEKYNRVDVRRCFELENKTKYLAVARNVNAIGMCPCDDLYITRKIDNLVVKQAQIDKHYHFKTVIKEFDENGRMIQDDDDDDDKFEGAYVFPPKPGRYKNTKVFDYSSLYPNVIKTLNISPDTLVTDESVPDEMCIKTPSGHKFRKDFVGILPKVIAGMKDKRDFYKDLMSKEIPGSLMHKTYDNLQYVYKSFGLSFYGALGEIHTRFYDIRIAESVTLGGQYFNKAGAKFLEDKGYIILYGDTDSLFVDHIKSDDEVVTLLEEIKELCEKIAKEEFNADICTLEMSYDKGFKTFLIVNAKKRYAGYIDYLDGHVVNPCKLKITGFEYVRTDQCGFVKKYQKEVLEWILSDEPPTAKEIRAWILDKQTKVFSSKLPVDELMFAQKVTKPLEQYDKPMMHTKVAEQMIKDGKDFWIGDKVQYFIESFDTRKKPLPKPLYAFKGKYNESYYWNNKIFPAFERILVVAYPSLKWDEYYIKGASSGSAKSGRSFLWD